MRETRKDKECEEVLKISASEASFDCGGITMGMGV